MHRAGIGGISSRGNYTDDQYWLSREHVVFAAQRCWLGSARGARPLPVAFHLRLGLGSPPMEEHRACLCNEAAVATAASMFLLMPTRMVIVWIQAPREDEVRSLLVLLFVLFENSRNLLGECEVFGMS